MSESAEAYPQIEAARTSKEEQRAAYAAGRRDGRRGLHCPDGGLAARISGPGTAPENALTPYIAAQHALAQTASSQIIAELLDANATLVRRLYVRADTLVRRCEGGLPIVGASGRFASDLNAWRSKVDARHNLTLAVIAHTNQLISIYWTAVLRYHRHRAKAARPPCQGMKPMLAEIDPVWAKPDPFLLLAFGAEPRPEDEATTLAARIFWKALRISGFPTTDCQGIQQEGEQ